MNKNLLMKYARLVVEVGINLQKSQTLVVRCPVECAEFGRMLTTAAFDVGAKDVIINWSDDHVTREHCLRADDSLFDSVYPWTAEQFNTLAKEGAGFISVAASNPENLKGVDPDRLRRSSIATGRDMGEYYKLMMSNGVPWCVVSVPVESWACKVFPDLSAEDAMEALWNEIFKAVRISEDSDPVALWQQHSNRLGELSRKLNDFDFQSLHFTNSLGTDLVVQMPENHNWMGGSEVCRLTGIPFVANMPTEEIFSAPLRTGVDGVLFASMPLILGGNMVDGIRLTFKDGRITEIHADKGEEILRSSVETDEGSHYLGEIALVPYDSPISKSGVLFYNTLFDENASCHFAFGEAYPSCIKGGDDMSKEELIEKGLNAESNTHVDFMVGTADLSIIGTTRDGRTVEVFKNGNFAI